MNTIDLLPRSAAALLSALFLLTPSAHAALSGTKSIGPAAADYPNLGAAILDIQAQTVGGALVLELQAAYVSSVETFPLVVPALNGASAVNTVTIRPASGATALSLTSADTTAATLDLHGAQFVTFDGRPGGVGTAKQLTIANTSSSGVAVRFINEANGNALLYLTLRGVNTSATSGTVVFSTTTGANGNDNNTIDTCDLRDGATTPANALYSSGSTVTPAQNNSGNTVANSNIFNFYAATAVDAAGVRIESGNTDWILTGNNFYQTASRAAVNANIRAIYINNPSGNNFTVTGNFIGGSAPSAGGTAWTTTGTSAAYQFIGIQLNVGSTTPSSVQGNTIKNITWTTSNNTAVLPGVWSGIYLQAGNVNVGTTTGNPIGSGTGTGSISFTTSGSGGTAFGIGSTSSGTVAIANNTIGSITVNGASTGVSASLSGIQVTAGANTISNNLVGSAGVPSPLTANLNSLNAATSSISTSVGQQVTGILSSSITSASITGNTVANLNNNATTASGSQIRGIVTSAGVNTVTGNTVRNLSTTSANTFSTTSASVLGISQSSPVAGQTVSQNVLHSLANTAATATVNVFGIYYSGSTTTSPNLIARNLVHSLAIASTSTSSQLYGTYFKNGTFTAQNNMVRVGLDANAASTASASVVNGIRDSSTTAGRNLYHNSVYVGGTQTSGGGNSTYAFIGSDRSDVRNNIFLNARSDSAGNTKHYAVRYDGDFLTMLTANNNLFFVSGTGGVLGQFRGTDYTTLAAWQTATGVDAASLNTDPRFINSAGTAATGNMHLQASSPAEGAGTLVASVTDDFDGQTRSALSPVDLGADAGDFGVSINYPLLSNGTTANRVLTGWASIASAFGVSGGANAPRFYFKKATEADVFGGNNATFNGWKYVAASNGSSPYNFSVDYSRLTGGGVSNGDVIQYFVVAQDGAGNFRSAPYGATTSASPPVQHVSSKPANAVNSYGILATLSGGTVTVGPGGTCPNLSGAFGLFAALNIATLTSNLTVNLTGDTTEDGSTVLNAFTAPFTVTVQPDSTTTRTISGSVGSGLIRLNGAQRVTLEGSFGGSGRYLTFRNTSTTGAAPAIVFISDASNNTVSNCVLEGMRTSVVLFSTGVTTGNDNNTVTGNQIRDRSDVAGVPANLVYSGGSSATVANSNNTISNNELFNFSDRGAYVSSGSDSWTITGNTIYQTAARTTQLFGIIFNGLGTNTICGNTVRDLTTSSSAYGIYLSTQTGSTTVAGNRVWNLGNTAASTGVARGILVQPGSGQSVTVVNNLVALSSSGSTAQGLYGIQEQGETGSTTLTADNTVLITGTGSAGMDTWAFNRFGPSTATVKNNLFLNLRTGGGNHFAANRLPASTGPLTMDYNVYAGSGLTTAADFFDASKGVAATGTPIPYAQWQMNVPTDNHSSADNPGGNFSSAMFVDPANGDLHLVPGGNPLVNGKGTPIPSITTDIDGHPRSSTAPFIGADELVTPFQLWAQANAAGSDPAASGANGLANLLNFAFGLNPNIATRNALSYAGNVIIPGSITTELLSGIPTAEFIRRADYLAAGLTYTAQFSANLTTWEPATVAPAVLATDGVYQVVGMSYPLLSGGAQARFFRLVVGLQ